MEYVILNNGVRMPILGYGVFQVTKDECKDCVANALKVGYRLIDTAQSYGNEEEVGEAIKESGIAREDIFLTTKVWIDNYSYEGTKKSIYESMRKLKTDYLDLVLLHQPFCDYHAAYKSLEDLYLEGKIKAIGISNFSSDRMVDLALDARIKPMINQIETNPLNQQVEEHKWMEKYNIQHESWAPFGEGKSNMFQNETLNKIALKYNKSIAQVILKWQVQRGIVVIPKSLRVDRMKENLNIFDFNLSEEDMGEILKLDTKTSLFFSHSDPHMVEWFYDLIKERKGKI